MESKVLLGYSISLHLGDVVSFDSNSKPILN